MDEYLCGSAHSGFVEMASHDLPVRSRERGVEVQIDLAILLGGVAQERCHLHLTVEGVRFILPVCDVIQTDDGMIHGADAGNASKVLSLIHI
jgi:hypothetical protein